MHENRETRRVSGAMRAGPAGEGMSYSAGMHAGREPESAEVPMKYPNKSAVGLAHAPDPVPGKGCPRVCLYGSVRGAGSNLRPCRD